MQLMELLFDEKRARHQLEQTVMKLQNKVNLVLRTCNVGNLTLTNNSSYEEV
jgi:hypothetical protein